MIGMERTITKADNEEIEVRLMLQWFLSYYSLL